MKRQSLLLAILSVFFISGLALADHDEYGTGVIRVPNSGLDIDVWVDRGNGATYNPGDDIRIHFKTNRDAFVVIYNVDTRGYVHLLYPYDYRESRFVEGRNTYSIPSSRDDYDLIVDGPAGTEQIVAIASWDPFDLPNLGWYSDDDDEDYYLRRDDDEDEEEFIENLNRRIIPPDYDNFSIDATYFTVKYRHPRSYYTYSGYYGYPYYGSYGSFGACYFDYPYGAAIYIDGFFYGYSPLFLPHFLIGRHYVSIIYHHRVIYRDYFHVYHNQKVAINVSPYKRVKFYNERFKPKDYRQWSDKIIVRKEVQPLKAGELKKLTADKAYKQNLKYWKEDSPQFQADDKFSKSGRNEGKPGKNLIDYPDKFQKKPGRTLYGDDNSDGGVIIQKQEKKITDSPGQIQNKNFKAGKKDENPGDESEIQKQERKVIDYSVKLRNKNSNAEKRDDNSDGGGVIQKKNGKSEQSEVDFNPGKVKQTEQEKIQKTEKKKSQEGSVTNTKKEDRPVKLNAPKSEGSKESSKSGDKGSRIQKDNPKSKGKNP
ncbi:MAG: PEGA protein [candidate division Zixibacteria bacterium RBG-1]|nr:MAG: PEGA protein [candidate division Zixibacteria bacterium RBG-1]